MCFGKLGLEALALPFQRLDALALPVGRIERNGALACPPHGRALAFPRSPLSHCSYLPARAFCPQRCTAVLTINLGGAAEGRQQTSPRTPAAPNRILESRLLHDADGISRAMPH